MMTIAAINMVTTFISYSKHSIMIYLLGNMKYLTRINKFKTIIEKLSINYESSMVLHLNN